MVFPRFSAGILVLSIAATSSVPAVAEKVSFRRAVELSLRNSTGMAIANLDQRKAERNYAEARAPYLPQVTIGAGLGYSYGFPLSIESSAPTLFNVNSQQVLFNAAQREFTRAAKAEWGAFTRASDERKAEVILETALTYVELDRIESAAGIGRQEQTSATRVEQVSYDRWRAGIDSEVEVTKAKLSAARVRFAAAQAIGQAEVLRTRLAQLTGLSAASIETVTESIPRLPAVPVSEELTARAIEASPAVRIAEQQAVAKELRAKGEKKEYYPSLDLASQYGVLARYNNYDVFFRRFQRNNFTVGGVIRFPFLNPGRRAHADAAELEALKAKKQAEDVKNQVATETIKLQRSIVQLAAAREVSRLEYQLAGSDVQVMQAKLDAGSVTVRDRESARLNEDLRYSALLDATLELDKAQIQLLRATGEIESWALGR